MRVHPVKQRSSLPAAARPARTTTTPGARAAPWAAAGLCLLLSAGAARAGSEALAPASPGPDARVAELVRQGSEDFAARRYDDAVRALEAAYALQPQPLFLFNIAQALRKAGRLDDALAAYQRFLATPAEAHLRAEAESHIAAIQTQRETARSVAEERRKLQEEAARLRVATPAPPPVYRRPWFWGVVGAVVAVGAGVGLGVGIHQYRRDPATDLGTLAVVPQ